MTLNRLQNIVVTLPEAKTKNLMMICAGTVKCNAGVSILENCGIPLFAELGLDTLQNCSTVSSESNGVFEISKFLPEVKLWNFRDFW